MATATAAPQAHTPLSRLARELGVPIHRLNYIVLAKRIDAADRFGNCRVYDAAAVEAIKRAVARGR